MTWTAGPEDWPDDILLRCNHAGRDVLLAHLRRCDDTFIPALSSRVSLEDYADRLMDRAERMEAWHVGPAGEALVGLVAIYCNDVERTDAFITSVSVETAHRGAGLGSGLVEAALRRARAAGFTHVGLKVHPGATAARRAYARLGFRETGQDGAELTLRCALTP